MTPRRPRSTAFAPATVANVACGFDVLGLALDEPGDTVTAELGDEPGLVITEITGDQGRLSREPEKNTATVAAQKILERDPKGASLGIRLELRKGLPLASGMGGSAASAVAAALAVRDLLRLPLGHPELLAAALEGERVVAGAGHADNAAACLYGGLVLVRSTDPLDVVSLPIPSGLSVAVLRPHLEMSTKESRVLLGDQVRLKDAVRQWANVGALVSGLYSGDLDLVARSLVDSIAEPVRSRYVPGFSEVKRAAIEAGALGSSLSGSGPSIFALCRNLESAHAVSRKMAEAFADAARLEWDLHVSKVSPRGARVILESSEREAACAT
jgi:homoserine kinase